MNIAITEVSGLKDTITAAGIKTLLEAVGIPVELGQAATAPGPATAVAAVPVTTQSRIPRKNAKSAQKQLAPPPVKLEIKPKPAPAKSKPAKVAKQAPEADAPRITVRQRITELLKSGPKTAIQASNALREQGVNTDAHLIGQHFYLMVRDGLAERDEAIGGWRLK